MANLYLFGHPGISKASGRLFLHRLSLLYEAVSKVPVIQRWIRYGRWPWIM